MNDKLLDQARLGTLLRSRRLQMVVPSVMAQGEAFELKIAAFDAESLPATDWEAEIVFEGSVGIEGLPRSARLGRGAGGALILGSLRAVGPDFARVAAHVDGWPCASNPAWVFADPPYRVYWGDLHVHTTYSNCIPWSCQDPEFGYAYARDAAGLDFAAAADHLRGIASSPARWPRLQDLARRFNEPGRFVSFLAFESSHKTGFGGDINAYFLDDDAPYFWVDREDMRGIGPAVTLEQLWAFLDATGKRYFTVPHHTGRAVKYRSFADRSYDAAREPLFEIYSAWGSSERRGSRYPLYGGNAAEPAHFGDALRAGCRYGVIASSDDHTTLPGGESRNWGAPFGPQALAGYHHMGLAAVRAPELTRAALFEGLQARRTYGTTFERSLVDLRIGDLAMGEHGSVGTRDPLRRHREIAVRLSLHDAGGGSVTLLRNGEDLAAQRLPREAGPVAALAFADEQPLEEIAIRNARFHPGPFAVYYARIENQRGQTQWTSPIWLDL